MKPRQIPTKFSKKRPAKTTLQSAYSTTNYDSRLMILPKQKSLKDGLCHIYVEITFKTKTPDGTSYQPKRLQAGVRIPPNFWSQAKERIKETYPDNYSLNNKIENAHKAVKEYCLHNIAEAPYLKAIPTELQIIEKTYSRKDKKTLLEYFKEYVEYRQTNSTRETWKGFRTINGRLERYQQHTNEVLFFESITFEWAERFKEFAKKIDLDPNTLKKHFEDMGTILNHYYSEQEKLGFTLTDDFRDKTKFRKVAGTHSSEPTPLYQKEIEALMNFQPKKDISFVNNKGEKEVITVNGQFRTKKLFLLSCFTGLRFSDVSSLKKGHIQDDTIVIKAQKTDRNKDAKNLHIPLFSYAKDILEEINFDIKKLKLANQTINKYLKVILKEIGIDTIMIDYSYSLTAERTEQDLPKYELVSFHSGRDTFITSCLIAGIDVPTVMSWSGHSKYETFKKYIRLSENYLKTQQRKADRFFNQFKLPKHIKA